MLFRQGSLSFAILSSINLLSLSWASGHSYDVPSPVVRSGSGSIWAVHLGCKRGIWPASRLRRPAEAHCDVRARGYCRGLSPRNEGWP